MQTHVDRSCVAQTEPAGQSPPHWSPSKEPSLQVDPPRLTLEQSVRLAEVVSLATKRPASSFLIVDASNSAQFRSAPVVMRTPKSKQGDHAMPWKLLGVHSARMDMATRDLQQDESLGLNCAWYADILMTLTERNSATPTSEGTDPAG